MKGSPLNPDRIYASQSSGWYGQHMQRSDDGGATWNPVGNEFTYKGPSTSHQWYDGSIRPWEFKRVWHIEPSHNDPDSVYAGIEDAALFNSIDGGNSWDEITGLRNSETGPLWQPGAGGMCLHTIIADPSDKDRIYVAISAAGVFRMLLNGDTLLANPDDHEIDLLLNDVVQRNMDPAENMNRLSLMRNHVASSDW